MAKNTGTLESSAKIVTETAEQVTARSREAIENYFNWLQKTMSEVPWGSTELNKKLLGYATESFTAPFVFVQKIRQKILKMS